MALGEKLFGLTENGYWNLPLTWQKFLAQSYHGFSLVPTGMRHRKKYKGFDSINYRLLGAPGAASHVHSYNPRKSDPPVTFFFIHDHEKHKPISKKRKFGIRCVKPD